MMKVYDASNTIVANLLKSILEREGIDVFINGEYLQGGIGELPAIGLISIMVEEEDAPLAEKIIAAWEKGDYALDDE